MAGNICVINGQCGRPPGGLLCRGLPPSVGKPKPSPVTDLPITITPFFLFCRLIINRVTITITIRTGLTWVVLWWLTRNRPGKCFGQRWLKPAAALRDRFAIRRPAPHQSSTKPPRGNISADTLVVVENNTFCCVRDNHHCG